MNMTLTIPGTTYLTYHNYSILIKYPIINWEFSIFELISYISIHTLLQHMEINSNKSFCFCYPFPSEWGIKYARTIVLARFLIYYAVPLIIIGIFYILIARHLMFSASVPGEIQGAVRQVSFLLYCM